MGTYRITYVGPAALAVPTATLLADAVGIKLTASAPPARRADDSDEVVLALTVEGSAEAVVTALEGLRARLPAGATVASDVMAGEGGGGGGDF